MKIGITGTHGTGKTTLAHELTLQLKIENRGKSVAFLAEPASYCPMPINQDGTNETQLWIFAEQLRRELELSMIHDIVVCDRTIMDAVAYTRFLDLPSWPAMFHFAVDYLQSYDQIIFLTAANNDHCHADGIRDANDTEFRSQVENILFNLYIDAAITPEIR